MSGSVPTLQVAAVGFGLHGAIPGCHAEVEALLKWIANPPQLPTVVQAAMAHYQFESLHPYSDGNGRLGRLLIIVQLLRGAVIRASPRCIAVV